ncbi:nucleotidyltransferase family protein [Paraburkholderia kururiensis]|uniref:nucleotidyltransferase family protein n=1 Tax=Paraburkholderia kururiensis TaxID=984307 RepID=UPI0009DD41A2|nr:nucleotidyltransferase family protein [Paraburkholderia kururiensis]
MQGGGLRVTGGDASVSDLATKPASADELHTRLVTVARESEWFWSALVAVRSLRLSSWCIGAGAVRNLVWDALHDFRVPSPLADVDVAHIDRTDLSPALDARIQRRLTDIAPATRWDVTNQAAVHTWFEATFGHAVAPLLSLQAAVASWPEFATSVGLVLNDDDSIDVIAPYGLDDLFAMVVRRNPARVSVETYRRRIAQKQYRNRWPRVTIVAC